MGLLDAAGYLASGLVFLAFCMKAIVPLRIVAVASNMMFIIYGLGLDLIPVVALHCALLPMNCWRLRQVTRPDRLLDAGGQEITRMLRPFMTEHRLPRGTVLLRGGEPAHQLYCVVEGTVLLRGSGIRLNCGALVGGHSLVSASIQQLETVICETDVTLLRATEEALFRLCGQNPGLGLTITRQVVRRWMEDLSALCGSPAHGAGFDLPGVARVHEHDLLTRGLSRAS
jgi:hypothetical protein